MINLNRIKSQSGFSLIEMMVVIIIISFVIIITASLADNLFNSATTSGQILDQQQERGKLFGFLSSRIGASQPEVGLSNDVSGNPCNGGIPACTDPLTIAGDQFVFRSNRGDDNLYYRVWYDEANDRIRAATGTTAASIAPKRGPSQAAAIAADPILDGNPPAGVKVFTVARNVVDAPSSGSPPAGAPNPFVLFDYYDIENSRRNETTAVANNGFESKALRGTAGNTNTSYSPSNFNQTDIYSVGVNGYFNPPVQPVSSVRVRPSFDTQRIQLRQLCREVAVS